MNAARTPTKAIWAATAALLLAGLAWLLWGDYLRPHEAVRVIASPPAVASAPAPVEAAALPASAAPSAAAAPDTPAQQPLPQTATAPINPGANTAVTPAGQDPLVAFRRAIEEAQARQATPGATAQSAPHYTSLPEAIEAARRAQQASAPLQPAPQPAPGAGLNPFGSSR